MASVDQDPQQVGIEDFRGFTHATDSPVNKSTGVGLTGIGNFLKESGNLLKDSAKLDDSLTKEDAKNEVYNTLEPQRQAQIESLADKYHGLGGTGDLMPYAPGPAAEQPPASLDGFKDQVTKIASARASKDMPDLYYRAQINTLAKSLRSNYPGYRDFIDKTISGAGFGNPANELISSYQKNINDLNTSLGDPQKKAIEFANSHMQLPGMAEHLDNIQSGKPGAIPMMYHDANNKLSTKFIIDGKKDQIELDDLNQKTDAKQVGLLIDQNLSMQAADNVAADRQSSGTDTFQGAQKWLSDVQSGRIPEDQIETRSAEYATKLDAQIQMLRNQSIADGRKKRPIYTRGPDGQPQDTGKTYTWMDTMGGKEAYTARVNQNLSELVALRDSITNKEFGTMHLVSNLITARKDSVANDIMGDPVIGRYVTALDFYKQFPELNREMFARMSGDPKFMQALPTRLQAIVQHTNVSSGAPNPPPVAQTIEKVEGSKALTDSQKANITEGIFSDAQTVADKSLPEAVRRNKANAFFSAYNSGMLKMINEDTTNAYGQPVRGRFSVYSDFARPQMVSAMKELGGKTWDDYQGFMQREFSEVLFKPQIQAIRELGSSDPRIHLVWNDTQHQYHVDVDGPNGTDRNVNVASWWKSEDPDLHGKVKAISKTINKLNHGIDSYSHVVEASGKPVDAEIVSTMKAAGLQDPQGYQSNTSKLIEAFQTMAKKSNEKNEKLQEGSDKAKARFWKGFPGAPQ